MNDQPLAQADPQVADIVQGELARERGCIELIASENFTSRAVMEAVGSVLTNKYAEGYPAHRYYGGCDQVDRVENLARERVCKLYDAGFANVQPHSGASANLGAYFALVSPGETILGMSLAHGGHLTHGSPVNFSGSLYNVVPYGVDLASERIDYDALEQLAKEHRPRIIVAGASAYPRIIDFERLSEIAHGVDAYLMVDMAHIAGLVAGGVHPSPVPSADIVTSTSHKTLRGPRGGFILTNNEEIAKKVDKAMFPGAQGGPLMHVIAGKAVAFGEALQPSFKEYAEDVVKNAAALGEGIVSGGLRLVSGGTDNHLCLVDLSAADVTGKDAECILESVGLTVNKNTIPDEKRSPFVASGIRVGSAAGTTRGLDEEDFKNIGEYISYAVFHAEDKSALADIRNKVKAIVDAHPLYPGLGYVS